MSSSSATEVRTSNYQVKSIEPVMMGTEVRARLFTLAPRDVIPWHLHSEAADHYFVLAGELMASMRSPEETSIVGVGRNYRIPPGRPHSIANRSIVDCQFLLLQGVGKLDWVKVDD